MSIASRSDVLGETSHGSKRKRYLQYQQSGLEWMQNIPAHWKIVRCRFVCRVNPPKSELVSLDPGTEVSFVPMEDIATSGLINLKTTRAIREVLQGYTHFREDDVLIAKITPCFENGKGAVCSGLTNGIGFGTTELHVLRPDQQISKRFLFMLTKTDAYRSLGTAAMTGAAGQQRISDDFVKDFRIPLPPLDEQHAIANFLDHETAKIDSLIQKKERLTELLQEKRTALISNAVTKGIDPNVPMKDSGVEWLGKIPEHWDVKRLKYAAKLESGHTPSRGVPEYWVDCDIPWVTLNDVGYLANHDCIFETTNYINDLGLANSSARILPSDTVILSRDATVGRCGILGRPMATSQHFVDWICGDGLIPKYLLHIFRTPMQQEFMRLTMGATLRTIGMPDVHSFSVPMPPVTEQKAIINYIEDRCHRIDRLTEKTTQHVEKLREYRSALISAAVTGKIDVRGEVQS